MMQLQFFEEADQETTPLSRSSTLPISGLGSSAERAVMSFRSIRSLIYFVDNDIINVVAVAHENRKPGYWRNRLRR